MDKEVLSFFDKFKLWRREPRWFETLGLLGTFAITLRTGRIYVLQDALSTITNDKKVAIDIEVSYIGMSKVVNVYPADFLLENWETFEVYLAHKYEKGLSGKGWSIVQH